MNFLRRYIAFTAFVATMIASGTVLAFFIDPPRALLAGFDAGALIFLSLLLLRFNRETAEKMRHRAADNEPDHHSLVIIALLIVAVILTAVWVELAGSGHRSTQGIILAACTLSLAWPASPPHLTLPTTSEAARPAPAGPGAPPRTLPFG